MHVLTTFYEDVIVRSLKRFYDSGLIIRAIKRAFGYNDFKKFNISDKNIVINSYFYQDEEIFLDENELLKNIEYFISNLEAIEEAKEDGEGK